ncbi:8764_t:CDS:2 [Acaulospora morrowiae]|uniref:8764_t:CDS:1 n=1 Tax=Acaulospora morrowiae TaxID=94023 RepID=A0A9N9BFI0_9GLOM|nr:8764_t:CDS:2 [Acaulospora morrowiae]
MKKHSIILLLAVWVVLIQGIFAQTTSCSTDKTFCVTITPPLTSSASSLATFKLVAPSTVGWVSVGIGSSMIDNYLVMAWPTTTNTVAISQRIATSYSVPILLGSQSDITLDPSSGIKDGFFTVIFTRPSVIANSTFSQDTKNFVWAMQSTSRPSDDSTTTTITMHDSFGYISLDGGMTDRQKYILAHGIVMFLVWGLIVPASIYIIRFARNILPGLFFRLHWVFQVFLASPLIVIGWLLVLGAGVQFNPSNTHHVLGVAITALYFGQLTLGWIHHQLYDPERKYIAWWTKLHWWWGRTLVIIGFVQLALGLEEYNAGETVLNFADE